MYLCIIKYPCSKSHHFRFLNCVSHSTIQYIHKPTHDEQGWTSIGWPWTGCVFAAALRTTARPVLDRHPLTPSCTFCCTLASSVSLSISKTAILPFSWDSQSLSVLGPSFHLSQIADFILACASSTIKLPVKICLISIASSFYNQ